MSLERFERGSSKVALPIILPFFPPTTLFVLEMIPGVVDPLDSDSPGT